jgi:hypothetical protein
MGLPLPKVVADIDPSGLRIMNSLNGINDYANKSHQRRYNQVKADYAGLSIPAQAYSQLAYANAVGPQFMAKILANDAAVANMGSNNAKSALQYVTNAARHPFNSLPGAQGGNTFNGVGYPVTNSRSGNVWDRLIHAFDRKPAQGPGNAMNSPIPGGDNSSNPRVSAEGPGVIPNGDFPFVGREGYRPHPTTTGYDGNQMQIDMTGGQPGQQSNEWGASTPEAQQAFAEGREPTWAEKTGRLKGTVEEGKELGKHRADVINDIGEQQLALSNTGSNLDRIIEDINDPKFMELRKDFPFYQDMQLNALSKVGSPEQQEMIGNFIADVKSFAGSTVQQFKGASMKREFDYADQLKPNENDTTNTARGKLTALKTLKEIAEKKNDIILNLLQNKHMNVGDAVKVANIMVDDKAIAQDVKKLTSPMITLHDPKNPGITIRLPLWEARQRGVKNV